MSPGRNAATSLPSPASFAEIALMRVRRHGDAPYLLTVGELEPYTVQARSYALIARRATALATRLSQAGLAPGERVGCYFPNAPCWVVATLAVWWAGGVPAMVGTLLPGPEASRLCSLAGVRTVVAVTTAPSLSDSFRVLLIDQEGRLADEPDERAEPGEVPDYPLPRPEDAAAIFFTSGTTGRPKGITLTHGDLIRQAKHVAAAYARTSEYRPEAAPAHLPPGIAFNPFGHTAGFNRLTFRMWIGRPTLLVPKFTVAGARAVLARFSVDSLQLSPTMLQMLASADGRARPERRQVCDIWNGAASGLRS